MQVARQQMRSVAVPEIMEAYLPQTMTAQKSPEGATNGAGPDRIAILAHTDVMVVGQPDTKPQEPFGLLSAMAAQLGDQQGWQAKGAPLPVLGRLLPPGPPPGWRQPRAVRNPDQYCASAGRIFHPGVDRTERRAEPG